MKRILLAALITAFAAGSAFAQSCETKAMGKDGKPLAGAVVEAGEDRDPPDLLRRHHSLPPCCDSRRPPHVAMGERY